MAHAYPPHHNAGAEMTMHSMLRHLVTRGHDVHVQLSRDQLGTFADYDLDGVHVHRYVGVGDPMRYFTTDRVDVVIAHLENTLRAAALCEIHRVPLAHLLHNTHDFTKGALRRGPTQLAVFNSRWMYEDFEGYWHHANGRTPMPPSVVVHPPVTPEDYRTAHGKKITLINLNEDKGGELFWRLAEAMPDKDFFGVIGAYGEQIIPDEADAPLNAEVVKHVAPEHMSHVYSQTKILLMPSIYESYGRTAIEAAYCGIPTIAHPTPGLREALGSAGTFVDRDDLDGWVAAIRYLSSPRGFSAASKRAKAHAEALNPTADLDRFADAMEGVVRRGFATIAR
jgi:glycosyltransferase involved in cell wall biosynthesis